MNKTELKKEIKKQIKEELISNNYFIEQFRAENLTTVLKNYNKYCARINKIDLEIQELYNGNYTINNKKIVGDKVQVTYKFKDKIEQLEDRIEILEKTRAKLMYIKRSIEISIEAIKNEKYHEIIAMYYFEKIPIDSICNDLKISKETFKKKKSEFLSILKTIMYI